MSPPLSQVLWPSVSRRLLVWSPCRSRVFTLTVTSRVCTRASSATWSSAGVWIRPVGSRFLGPSALGQSCVPQLFTLVRRKNWSESPTEKNKNKTGFSLLWCFDLCVCVCRWHGETPVCSRCYWITVVSVTVKSSNIHQPLFYKNHSLTSFSSLFYRSSQTAISQCSSSLSIYKYILIYHLIKPGLSDVFILLQPKMKISCWYLINWSVLLENWKIFFKLFLFFGSAVMD